MVESLSGMGCQANWVQVMDKQEEQDGKERARNVQNEGVKVNKTPLP